MDGHRRSDRVIPSLTLIPKRRVPRPEPVETTD